MAPDRRGRRPLSLRPARPSTRLAPHPQPSPPMLRRIIYEDWQLIFPVVALAVASFVYLAAAWRATRMKPAQLDRLARLPREE